MRRVLGAWLAVPAALLAACHGDRSAATGDAVPPIDTSGTILFGDLHVHTSLSVDAQILGFTLLGGRHYFLPMQACEFARHCAALDFWSINDHAELLFSDEWRATQEAIRACNAAYELPAEAPDMVSFLGWEWTQNNPDAARHWGHKNVILWDTDAALVPTRPIGFANWIEWLIGPPEGEAAIGALAELLALAGRERKEVDVPGDIAFGFDLIGRLLDGLLQPVCAEGVPVRDLPPDCLERAPRPRDLYAKLDDWGFPLMIIPHGTTWGTHTPPEFGWDRVVGTPDFDPGREGLIEVYSGHGNSEQWAPHLARIATEDGFACPEPSREYEPCCWRAGEIARAHEPACEADPRSAACEALVAGARRRYADAGSEGFGRITTEYAARPAEWMDCGVCRTCAFNPTNRHRPGGSAQAALALGEGERIRFGLVGSTDVHRSGPGSGYKDRKAFSDVTGFEDPALQIAFEEAGTFLNSNFQGNSFLFAGGTMGLHARGRTREDIWEALGAKRVYATSGKRILLWFDVVAPELARPAVMGETVVLAGTPRFRVKALGDWIQRPGCPGAVHDAMGDAFVEQVCFGDCYYPGDERYPIDRIEVVRIRPRRAPGETLAELIDDPWLILPCDPDPGGCEATFTDPEYAASRRPAVYYARALHPPAPVLNAGNVRCQGYDADGTCTEIRPCFGGGLGVGDECTSLAQDRAWSSPIFLDPPEGT